MQIWRDKVNTKPEGLVWAIVARFMAVALFFDSLAPLFPQIAKSYHISDGTFQAMLGASYVAFAFSQLISIFIINLIGPSRTSSLSCLYLGLAAILLCLIQDSHVFGAVLLSMFAINSMGSNATRVALRQATSDGAYKKIYAWATGAIEIKQIAMPLIAGALSAAFGWRVAMTALVTPVVVAGVSIELIDRRQPEKTVRAKTWAPGHSGWKTLLTMPAFVKPTLIAAAFQIAFAPLSARLPFLLANDARLTPTMVGLVLSASTSAVAGGLFVSGYLAPRWPGKALMQTGAMIMMASAIAMLFSHMLGVCCAIAAAIIMQAAFGFIIPPCSGGALSASEQHRITASAIFGFVQAIVAGLSVAIAGASGLAPTGAMTILPAITFATIVTAMVIIRE